MQTSGREGNQGDHENYLLFAGRVSGHRRFYYERVSGVGGDIQKEMGKLSNIIEGEGCCLLP